MLSDTQYTLVLKPPAYCYTPSKCHCEGPWKMTQWVKVLSSKY